MSRNATSYDSVCANFRWDIPSTYNVGDHVCGRGAADPADDALVVLTAAGEAARYSFSVLDAYSNRLANRLAASGLVRGDRVLVLLPPSFEAAVANIAVLKAGLILVPLSSGVTAAAAEMRLRDSGARLLMAHRRDQGLIDQMREALAELSVEVLMLMDDRSSGHSALEALTDGAARDFQSVQTSPDDPAFLVFTSGSEGRPKGVLHAHRQVPAALSSLALRARPSGRGELTWTPAEWSWLMGLNIALCAWHTGAPVLVQEKAGFDAGGAMKLMADHGVRHATLAPTALRLMQKTDSGKDQPRLLSMATGGEAVGGEIFDWVRQRFGVVLQEFYGMSECPGLIGNGDIMEARRGAMGKALPGHDVQVVDEEGRVLPAGESGCIAVHRSDPGLFLGFWDDNGLRPPEFVGEYYRTSDLARKDAEGYVWYLGRADDIIKSSGYRVGPTDIEDCVMTHPAVELAGAVGVPDSVAGQVVKLWVKLKAPEAACDGLKRQLLTHARQGLATYQWPRSIEFIEHMPMTTTGKISRRELRARE